ncbi:FkbM family methyltransferase [Ancylobacter sp.]|uniref:FkbM family methyltransferase n=1 Tax=Ancylobacter sp. TaxID=1872567 RepID=UPI003BAA27DF
MGMWEVLRTQGWLSFVAKTPRRVRRVVVRKINKLFNRKIVRSFYGVFLTENSNDVTFRFCVDGAYGKFYSNYLQKIDCPFIFIDIGANQGLYFLIAAQNPYCERAISLEPVNETFGFLTANIRANGLAGMIVALNCGLSSEKARVNIRLKPGHSGAASLHNTFAGTEAVEEIQISTAAVLEPYLVPGLPLVVKIDTEGHEHVVIAELARSRFADRVMSVFYEVDVAWADPENLEAGLRAMGFDHFHPTRGGTHYDVMATRQAAGPAEGRAA